MQPRHRRGGRRRRAALATALAAACLAAAPPAAPGAWPREPGTAFVSLRAERETGRAGTHRGTALYGEYGLTDRLTLGAQWADHSEPTKRPRAGVFGRWALPETGAGNRFALSLGASAATRAARKGGGEGGGARLDAGVHWGRGFASPLGPGWATARLGLHFAADGSRPVRDLHALLGVRPADDWMVMASFGEHRDADATYRKLGPSLGYRLRGELWGVLGATRELGNDRSTALALSLWLSF